MTILTKSKDFLA